MHAERSIADLVLTALDGNPVELAHYQGRRHVLFRLGVLVKLPRAAARVAALDEEHGPVDFIAVAADAQGPKAAQPWVERAGATFAVAVDSENKLGALLGYTVVPTGVFVDEQGLVRHLQAGDFSVRDEHTLARVERFLAGDVDVLEELKVESSSRLEPLAQELVDAKVSLASELLARGGRDEALEALDRALELDPDNYLIRKQRWTIRNPERFQPEIDWDWQTEQLTREREAERQARETACSPDGCPIPQ